MITQGLLLFPGHSQYVLADIGYRVPETKNEN